MGFQHQFTATLQWTSQDNLSSVSSTKTYPKSHQILIEGKSILEVSAAKAFKGDPSLYNPEDLLLSSLVSCHMMSYLYICSKHNITVLSYTDTAIALLETSANASGRFLKVELNPIVVIADKNKVDLASALHEEANKLCFIANSCNFPVLHYPTCRANDLESR